MDRIATTLVKDFCDGCPHFVRRGDPLGHGKVQVSNCTKAKRITDVGGVRTTIPDWCPLPSAAAHEEMIDAANAADMADMPLTYVQQFGRVARRMPDVINLPFVTEPPRGSYLSQAMNAEKEVEDAVQTIIRSYENEGFIVTRDGDNITIQKASK